MSGSHPGLDATVRFLDDDACRAVIERVEPKLVPHFDEETQGMYKADVCRVAALYEEGGYYFDIDMAVIEPLALDADVGFSTAFEAPGNAVETNLFQSFLAAAPRHPILKEALRIMLAYYEWTHKLHGEMGTSTLKDAHDAVPKDKRGTIRWLHEMHLKPGEYPELTRQEGTECCCNYVVHDETEHKPYFWSRIVGSGHC
jgi:mannosyltransferase OCH1-like enzyme